MSTTNTTHDSQASDHLGAAVADFEAACFDLLRAFNDAGGRTQSRIFNVYVYWPDLDGLDFRFGAVNLAAGAAAMNAATAAAGGQVLAGPSWLARS